MGRTGKEGRRKEGYGFGFRFWFKFSMYAYGYVLVEYVCYNVINNVLDWYVRGILPLQH